MKIYFDQRNHCCDSHWYVSWGCTAARARHGPPRLAPAAKRLNATNLVADGGFESSVSGFYAPSGGDSVTRSTLTNPITGTASLDAVVWCLGQRLVGPEYLRCESPATPAPTR